MLILLEPASNLGQQYISTKWAEAYQDPNLAKHKQTKATSRDIREGCDTVIDF